jgi:hypothetical protein
LKNCKADNGCSLRYSEKCKLLQDYKVEEACKVFESGFQHVTDYDNGKIFRKPK